MLLTIPYRTQISWESLLRQPTTIICSATSHLCFDEKPTNKGNVWVLIFNFSSFAQICRVTSDTISKIKLPSNSKREPFYLRSTYLTSFCSLKCQPNCAGEIRRGSTIWGNIFLRKHSQTKWLNKERLFTFYKWWISFPTFFPIWLMIYDWIMPNQYNNLIISVSIQNYIHSFSNAFGVTCFVFILHLLLPTQCQRLRIFCQSESTLIRITHMEIVEVSTTKCNDKYCWQAKPSNIFTLLFELIYLNFPTLFFLDLLLPVWY